MKIERKNHFNKINYILKLIYLIKTIRKAQTG